MNWLLALYRSTIGKKVVMAATGLILVGFVIGHVTGNLLVFRGPEKLNAYSAFLKSLGGLLWIVRGGLLIATILHVTAAVQLTRINRAARPIGYARQEPQVSTLASRTIRWGGALLLVFIVIHLLHFTTGTLRPSGTFSATDVYGNVLAGFRIWWVSLFYVVAMAALGLHLYHGTWSALRTLGAVRSTRDPFRRSAAALVASAVWLAFTIIPVAVYIGIVR
ncbi:MAG: succinate dehydrogenase cytochrome b subunit [Gemmatimonadaceae bacterium]